MKKTDANHLGIEIGPRLVRAVLLENGKIVRMAQREVDGPPEGAWDALSLALREIKPPPRTTMSVALLPPFINTTTLKDVPSKQGRTPNALRLRLQRTLQQPLEGYAISFVEQGGLHQGDLYVAFARKSCLKEIHRLAQKLRLRVERVEPWYQALPRPWITRERDLLNYPALFVGIHQGRLTYVGRTKGNVEMITHDVLPSVSEVVSGIENVYYELTQNNDNKTQAQAVVISTDDKSLYDAIVGPLGEAGFSLVYPEDNEQAILGDFALAAGATIDFAYAGLDGNLWTPSLEEEFLGRRVPPMAFAPVLVALLIAGLAVFQLEGQKANLMRAIARVDSDIAAIKADADRAAQLKMELDRKQTLYSSLEDSLFGKSSWTQRLEDLFGLLGRHSVAVSQLTLSTPPKGARTMSLAIASPKAESVFSALEEIERDYPKVTPAPVMRHKVANKTLYSTTVTVEVK